MDIYKEESTLDEMQQKKITKVADIIERIILLKSEIAERQTELDDLVGRRIQQTSPLPTDFDYKAEIMRLFKDRSIVLNVDNVVATLSNKHGFTPDRTTVAIRVGYLADSARPKKLERVPNRRGYYRLISNATEAGSSSG